FGIVLLYFMPACIRQNNTQEVELNIGIEIIDSLKGKEQKEIFEIFGVPNDSLFFSAKDTTALLEYQLNMIPYFRCGNIQSVKELKWKDEKKTVVVWVVNDNKSWKVAEA